MQEKILFISHDAGRTGAPLFLLTFLKWLKENTTFSFEILLRRPGPLQGEFAAIAPTSIYSMDKPSENFTARIFRKVGWKKNALISHDQMLVNNFRDAGINLIYSNTITNGDILETLAPLNCPVITHIHELNYWIEQSGQQNLEQVKKYSTKLITGSKTAQNNLAAKYKLPLEKIEVVHYFIPPHDVTSKMNGVRKSFDIPEDAFLVLGSGHETWRKGKDLFVQLASQVRKTLPDLQTHFLWVGGWEKDEYKRNILHDVEKLGLTGKVHFTGSVSSTLNYFATGDIFVMISREDPFPLVCLEAASLGKPIICFAEAGGIPELVETDSGIIVPYLDIPAMAEAVKMLALDQKMRTDLGEQGAKKVRDHYNVTTGSTKIYKIITNELAKSVEQNSKSL